MDTVVYKLTPIVKGSQFIYDCPIFKYTVFVKYILIFKFKYMRTYGGIKCYFVFDNGLWDNQVYKNIWMKEQVINWIFNDDECLLNAEDLISFDRDGGRRCYLETELELGLLTSESMASSVISILLFLHLP